MDILELDQELRSNKIRPCYLIAGEERHLALTAKKHLLKTVETVPDIFYAPQTTLPKILDVLKTPAMFTPWRCVVVEEAGHYKKKDWEEWKKELAKPLEKTVLILILDGFPAALKDLPPSFGIVECKKLYPKQVAGWINMEARERGVAISREAALFLVDAVGTDLGNLYQTLEMLTLYVGGRKIIQVEDVEIVAARTAQKNVFELTTAVGEKKPEQALKFLEAILDQGEEPLKVLAMIARQLRLLASAQEIVQAAGGVVPPDFAKKIGVHPFFAKEYAAQSKRWRQKGWSHCFESLLNCDVALKSSRHKPEAILGRLIWELCEK